MSFLDSGRVHLSKTWSAIVSINISSLLTDSQVTIGLSGVKPDHLNAIYHIFMSRIRPFDDSSPGQHGSRRYPTAVHRQHGHYTGARRAQLWEPVIRLSKICR